MKKINGVNLCYTLSILLFLGFIVKTIIDYSHYNSTLNSAPFYIWIIANAICLVVPSIVVLVVGLAIKNKTKAE